MSTTRTTDERVETARDAVSLGSLVPSIVVAPESPLDAAQVLCQARLAGHAVVPWGNGTAQATGAQPVKYDIACRTSRMASVKEYEPADLVISVGAGITIAAVQSILRKHGQFLALDGVNPDATVGGIVATNRSGPSRLLYGTARDLVLGITVALPNGDVVRSGGRVVKNVVGYDLNKLHVGALGTLGLICEVTMKIHPLPRAESSVVGRFTSPDGAFTVAHSLARSNLGLRAVDVTTDCADQVAPFATVVAAWCSGWPASVARQSREVATSFEAAGATSVETLSADNHIALREQVDNLRLRPARIKLAVLPDKLGYLQGAVAQALREARHIDATWVSRAGIGVAHLGLRHLDAHVLAKVRSIAEAMGGTCITEVAPGELQTADHAWGRVRDDFRIMARIRDEFDPTRTINPGRFVGGL